MGNGVREPRDHHGKLLARDGIVRAEAVRPLVTFDDLARARPADGVLVPRVLRVVGVVKISGLACGLAGHPPENGHGHRAGDRIVGTEPVRAVAVPLHETVVERVVEHAAFDIPGVGGDVDEPAVLGLRVGRGRGVRVRIGGRIGRGRLVHALGAGLPTGVDGLLQGHRDGILHPRTGRAVMVLAARPRAPDGPAHVGLKLNAALLEVFLRDALSCEGGLRVGRCLRSRRRESSLHTRSRLRGETERHPEENGDYRDYETRTAPLSDRFPRAHVIPFPLVVLALFYRQNGCGASSCLISSHLSRQRLLRSLGKTRKNKTSAFRRPH